MKALASEWKARDAQREEEIKGNIEEYAKLEDKLHETLRGLEQRESVLARKEAELLVSQRDLQQKYDTQLAEARDASRRLQLDFEHQSELERAKSSDLRLHVAQAKEDRAVLENRCRQIEGEFAAFRQQVAASEPARMQSDLNNATAQNLEQERRLDLANQAKQKYKMQWTRALREIAKLKQASQITATERMKREQKELAHMRLQYLAREEQEVTQNERKELVEIRNELHKLREVSSGTQATPTGGNQGNSSRSANNSDQLR